MASTFIFEIKYMQIDTDTDKINTYTTLIHANTDMYRKDLASRCSLEGCGVNVLGAKPVAVPKLDTGEELQGREHIWHALQAQAVTVPIGFGLA
jgi:hypothetical protein